MSNSKWITNQNHPLRLLLYLEWILLVILLVDEALPTPFFKLPRFALVNIPCLFLFSLMGLRLPMGSRMIKIIYTTIEFGLTLLAVFVGGMRLFPLLCIAITTRACLMFELSGRVVIAICTFGLFWLGTRRRFQSFASEMLAGSSEFIWLIHLSLTILFALCLIFLLLLVNALLLEQKSRAELSIANDRLRDYALKIEDQATLQERNRIARDIHDSLGHSLTALNIQLETALKLMISHPNRAQTFLSEAKRLGSKALQDVRQSVTTLRADPLENRSLENAINDLCQEFQRSTGTIPKSELHILQSLPHHVKIAIYRIVQESLTNICKYSINPNLNRVLQVQIQLETTTRELYLKIQDNGKGFDLNKNRMGFGLQGMQERTDNLGGTFQIQSSPGEGCLIEVRLPLLKIIVEDN